MRKQNIKISDLKKTIKGNIVLDINFMELQSGEIYGLYGKNGCGKTMLFRAITGLIIPDKGAIVINGNVLHKDITIPENIGALIETPGFFPYLSGIDNLLLLSKINKKIDREKICDIMTEFGLDPNNKKNYKTYSLGMKQKLGIIQALMEDPDIIILDEPTNSIDEDTIKFLRKYLLNLKEKNKLILIASHNKEDLAILADTVYKIENGKIAGEIVL